ncbi:hypothetical protein ACFZBM_04355 [Streptomyces lavendulae]|uniref:Uncharacterized protein n=1 Tax=Streptomyces lavendulae subsp. lavendulae TaxID=58340 RepID=A0A2K8P774_STRLA|nr:hypothetical protein [Streptomyces lavendulae]ATZ22602.1 hypothetical protein SLAV_03470 [Streptomyces lavendulae subsp. lavendulae]QUQ52444.1 hypothetical protein SLLC_01505 [Streptomyces lavendulae subsp. lavendulae]
MSLFAVLIIGLVVVVIALIAVGPDVPARRNPSVRRTRTRLTTVPAPREGRHRTQY